MIIALVNSKGGVGKSTIAGNLAGWIHDHGHRVVLADCDPQRSSSEWIREAAPAVNCVGLDSAQEVFEQLPALRSQAEFVVTDGPGSQTETSRSLLMWADLAIIPCKASMFEARALAKNTSFVRDAQAIRKGRPAATAVLCMVGENYRLTRDMKDAAAALQINLADTPLILRQSHADAPGQSTFVWRMGYQARNAAQEIDALFREIVPDVVTASVASVCHEKVPREVNA